MLTEKECREALENLKEYSEDYESLVCQFGENLDCYDIKPTYKYQKEIEIFEELITEYFKLQAQYCCVKTTADAMRDVIQHQLPEMEKELKNPPLRFEEIQKDMWIWDNIRKKYRQVYTVEKRHYTRFINFDGWEVIFQDGRFFRREVVENVN